MTSTHDRPILQNLTHTTTRQALTALIVRLFVDHASDAIASQQKEVGHDA